MDKYLKAAYLEAVKGLDEGGIPIGSVLVHEPTGKIIGRGHNRRMQQGSAILHAEMDAVESAGHLSAAVYRECIIYTTLSPCSMCSGMILLYRIPKVVIGENENFQGEEDLLKSRGVEVRVVNDPQCKALMPRFIAENPELWNEDIDGDAFPVLLLLGQPMRIDADAVVKIGDLVMQIITEFLCVLTQTFKSTDQLF